jgi:uncharacterized membrane protein
MQAASPDSGQLLRTASSSPTTPGALGSVNFDAVRGGRSTQVSVNLQYAPPAGKAGALIASLFGREPSQMIREDLSRFKQLLEAGETPRGAATP